MIFKHLHLEYFKQYEELDLEFREGLAGIIGRNGSGKSSIFEAMLLCLFGNASTEKEFYRSSWADNNQTVKLELTFEIQNKNFRVLREFRGKALTHYAGLYDYKNSQIASSANTVTAEITKLIGMDRDAFTRSIFSGQKELGILSETKGEVRKSMVRKMIGLDNLDRIQQLVRDDRNTIKKMIQGQEALLLTAEELKELETECKLVQKSLKQEQKSLNKLEKTYQQMELAYQKAKLEFRQLDKVYSEYNKLNIELNKFQEGLEHLTAQLTLNTTKKTELQLLEKVHEAAIPAIAIYEQQKVQLEFMEKEKVRYDESINLKQKIEYIDNQLVVFRNKLTKFVEVKTAKPLEKIRIEKLEATIDTHKTQQAENEKDLTNLISRRAAVQSRIDERRKAANTISELGKDANCPTCLQPLLDSYEQTLDRLHQEIEGYQQLELKMLANEIKSLQIKTEAGRQALDKESAKLLESQTSYATLKEQFQQLQEIEKSASVLEQQKTATEKSMQEIGTVDFNEQEYSGLKSKLKSFEARYLEHLRRAEQLKALPAVIAEIEALNERIRNGRSMIESRQKSMKNLKFSQEKYEQQKQAVEQQEAQKTEAAGTLNAHKNVLQTTEIQLLKIQNKQEEQERIKSLIQEQQMENDELGKLDSLFQSFKTYILNKIKPTISIHASQLFQQITKGRYEGIKVDEHFEFHIYENGDFYPIHRFSGGEIDLANLCLRIGISKAIAELSGSEGAFSFLGFDEIFGSQDEDRRHEILRALDLLKEQYRQIYIISHIDSVKEYFPNILGIRKTNSGSEARWL